MSLNNIFIIITIHRAFTFHCVVKIIFPVNPFINIYAETSLMQGNTFNPKIVIITEGPFCGCAFSAFASITRHHASSCNGLEAHTIDFCCFFLYYLVDVDIAAIICALQVTATNVLQFIEHHRVNPPGAAAIYLLTVGKCIKR